MVMRALDQWITAFRGPAQARAVHSKALSQSPGILSGVERLHAICPPDEDGDEDAPIFLLSAGWRSGSTLLQRLIMSDPSVLLWGEPYDECGVIQALAETVKAFRPDWPPADYYYDGTPLGTLSGNWIANLFPSVQELRKAHRAVLDVGFAEPARRAGALRWGLKEVRLGIEHATYLRWLYPRARFVFLYRNPMDAYRSYRRFGSNWYNVWPDKPVFTPLAFGRHWRKLLEGFLRGATELDALLVCYEHLIDRTTELTVLEEYLGIHVDRSVLGAKVGSSERSGDQASVSRVERWLLTRAVSPIAEELGYCW